MLFVQRRKWISRNLPRNWKIKLVEVTDGLHYKFSRTLGGDPTLPHVARDEPSLGSWRRDLVKGWHMLSQKRCKEANCYLHLLEHNGWTGSHSLPYVTDKPCSSCCPHEIERLTQISGRQRVIK
jgi:hypothetical protein